jgi:hypothetical protein
MPHFTVAETPWWKPTPDTIAAYLTLDDSKRLLSGASLQAPEEWQRKAKACFDSTLDQSRSSAPRRRASCGQQYSLPGHHVLSDE